VPSPEAEESSLAERRRRRAALPKWNEAPDLGAFLDAYRDALGRLAAAVRARGAEVVFVAQPTAYESIDGSPTEPILGFLPDPEASRVLGGPALRRVMDRVAGATVSEAQALAAPWVCLEGAVPRTPHFFLDDARLTDAGCAFVAEALAHEVEKAASGRPSPASQ
jgi:hypothetical protein